MRGECHYCVFSIIELIFDYTGIAQRDTSLLLATVRAPPLHDPCPTASYAFPSSYGPATLCNAAAASSTAFLLSPPP
jgi:hypothetical protein